MTDDLTQNLVANVPFTIDITNLHVGFPHRSWSVKVYFGSLLIASGKCWSKKRAKKRSVKIVEKAIGAMSE